jgi:head-tail adaptor
MSYGKMNGFAVIKQKLVGKDDDGFKKETEIVIATVRCYREGRHGSKRWANLASFTDATDLFRFRSIPDIPITSDYVIDYQGELFKILSVENVKGRGMYIEVLARKVESAVG